VPVTFFNPRVALDKDRAAEAYSLIRESLVSQTTTHCRAKTRLPPFQNLETFSCFRSRVLNSLIPRPELKLIAVSNAPRDTLRPLRPARPESEEQKADLDLCQHEGQYPAVECIRAETVQRRMRQR
jgi:hypothetical protein